METDVCCDVATLEQAQVEQPTDGADAYPEQVVHLQLGTPGLCDAHVQAMELSQLEPPLVADFECAEQLLEEELCLEELDSEQFHPATGARMQGEALELEDAVAGEHLCTTTLPIRVACRELAGPQGYVRVPRSAAGVYSLICQEAPSANNQYCCNTST